MSPLTGLNATDPSTSKSVTSASVASRKGCVATPLPLLCSIGTSTKDFLPSKNVPPGGNAAMMLNIQDRQEEIVKDRASRATTEVMARRRQQHVGLAFECRVGQAPLDSPRVRVWQETFPRFTFAYCSSTAQHIICLQHQLLNTDRLNYTLLCCVFTIMTPISHEECSAFVSASYSRKIRTASLCQPSPQVRIHFTALSPLHKSRFSRR